MKNQFGTNLFTFTLFIILSACSNPSGVLNKSGFSSKKDTPSENNKYSEVDLDTLTAGEGVTIGNGQNDEEEVNKETNSESFLLACIQKASNHFSCEVSKETSSLEDEIKNLKIYDRDGNIVPSDDVLFRVVESEGLVYLEIFIQSDAIVSSISNQEIPNANSKQQEEEKDEEEPGGSTEQASENNGNGEPQDEPVQNSGLDCNSIGTPGTWVLVPGDPDYGTSDFCVMKYEAKNNSGSPVSEAAGSPWAFTDQLDASIKCTSLGSS